jgi:anti-anti-sigma factor
MRPNHTCVLSLEGDLEGSRAEALAGTLDDQVRRGVTGIVANVKRVRFVDSKCIGCFIRARRFMTRRGGDLVLSEPSPFVARTIDVLGLGEIIRSFSSNTEALRHFGVIES